MSDEKELVLSYLVLTGGENYIDNMKEDLDLDCNLRKIYFAYGKKRSC